MKLKLSTDKILALVIALLLLTLVIVITVSIFQSAKIDKTAKMVRHTQEVLLHSEKLLSATVENETSSRGYALTGQKDFLEQLENSQRKSLNELTKVKTLTIDNKEQQRRIDSLSLYIGKRIEFSNITIALRDSKGVEGAITRIETGEGKAYTSKVRSVIEDLQAEENVLLKQRNVINEYETLQQNALLISLVLCMLILAGVFIQKVRIDFKEKRIAAASLEKLNSELEVRVKLRTDELLKSKDKLEETFLRINDGFIILDRNWCYTYVNRRAGELIHQNPEAVIGKNVWQLFPDAIDTATYKLFTKVMEERQYMWNEDYYAPLDLWQENHVYPSSDGISVYIRDITARKSAEEKNLKANRLYLFISQINQMIVRVTDSATLFREACEIAVNLGKFRMAWIGIIDETTKQIVPVRHAGEELKYLSHIKIISVDDIPAGKEKMGAVLRNGKYFICNDMEQNPEMIPWKETAPGLGYFSSMILPIVKFGNTIGVFAFYSSTKSFFDEAEIALLEEATGDIAFALEIFDKEELRKKAEDSIKQSNERFEMIARATNDVIWDWNLLTDELWWNDNYYTSFGYDKSLIAADANSWTNGIHPDDRKKVVDGIYQVVNSGGEYWHDEYRYLNSDGSISLIFDRGYVLHNKFGDAYRMIGSMFDITELKKAQDEIAKEKSLSDSIINSLPGIFYLYTLEGKFLRWNKNFEIVSKYSSDEIREMHPLDFFDETEKELLTLKIGNVFVVGEDSVQADFLLKTKQKIPYYFTGKAIVYEGLTCLMGVGIDFSERIRAQEAIKQTSEKLHQLTAHLQKIREEERKRIGREIHDELGQQLTAIKMDIAWIDKRIQDDPPVLKSKLKNVIQLLDGSNQSIRRILSELRPTILDDYELNDALEWLSEKFTENTGINVELKVSGQDRKLPEYIITCIFRVYQEALTNIARYASARNVQTVFRVNDDSIDFTVQDNGCGFDATSVQTKKSFGILGMKERVLSQKGDFQLETSPGNGTKIIIHIPFLR